MGYFYQSPSQNDVIGYLIFYATPSLFNFKLKRYTRLYAVLMWQSSDL